MKVERIELDGRDGPPRPAWSVAPEGDPRAGAAIFHSYGSSRDALLGLALTLAGGGFACVVPDLPGHGEHPEPLGPALLDDARRAVEHARRHGAVLAVGHSLGGRLALLSEADAVVAISPALPAQASPEGMYALQTFATPRVRQAYPGEVMDILRGLPPHAISGAPVLLVVGQGDIPSIVQAVEELAASLDSARMVRVSSGMLLDVDDPPPSFLSYIKHWVNHGGLHGNPDVKATVVAWADEVAGNVRVERR